jgi:antirestriction protein ArdC
MTYNKAKKTDTYELITKKLIALIEKGTIPWRKPWYNVPFANVISGHRYQGNNPLFLNIFVLENEWEKPLFATYKQAESKQWSIQKGSKAAYILSAGTGKTTVADENGEEKDSFYNYYKWIPVFNVAQMDDSEAEEKIEDLEEKHGITYAKSPNPKIEEAESFIKAQNAVIKSSLEGAFYSPSNDYIAIPDIDVFQSSENYYSTLLHELAHWTGHESRLKRNSSTNKRSDSYAYEELIAELSSVFLTNDLNINYELENHASYMQSWLKRLEGDFKFFFQATKDANKAVKFLKKNAGVIDND